MVGIALEGGGAKGAYEIGAFIALKQYIKKINMIAGTSIGALNAALMVQGDIKKAIDVWSQVDANLFGIDPDVINNLKKDFSLQNIKNGLSEIIDIIKNKGIDITPLKKLIANSIDEDIIRNSKINLGLVTINLSNLKPLELTINDIPKNKLTEYLLASCYLPIFKFEKIIDNKYYLDGGFYNNLPISLLEKNKCTKIYAIRLKDAPKINNKNIQITVIKPNKSLGPTILFNKQNVIDNIKMGYYDTLKALDKLIGKTYYFKRKKINSVNIKKVSKTTLEILKVKFKTNNKLEILYLSLEEVLFANNFEILKVYEIKKTLKMIKSAKLKCKNILVNEFLNNVNCLIG